MQKSVSSRGCASKPLHFLRTARCLSGLVPLLICFFAAAHADAQSTGACLPWPTTAVPFDSVYYGSGRSATGDRFVVGNMSMSTYNDLRSQLPAPSFVDQEFCGSVKLASGVYARAYVPTAAEWNGNFSSTPGVLRDPLTVTVPSPTNG